MENTPQFGMPQCLAHEAPKEIQFLLPSKKADLSGTLTPQGLMDRLIAQDFQIVRYQKIQVISSPYGIERLLKAAGVGVEP